MANPIAGEDYPRTFQEFLKWFPDDAACVQYLAGLRWPEGFVCPACGGVSYWMTGRAQWMCTACAHKTSITAGTIFHRTRTPLTTWFAAIWFVVSQKNGVSALGLQRVLGFGSYETAWAWMHKLRRAMVRPDRELLSGTVELDETWVGGLSEGSGGGAGGGKAPVMIAVERTGTRLGRVRMAVAERPNSVQIIDFATEVIAPGSTVRTDGARLFLRLPALGYIHEPTTGIGNPDQDSIVPGVHQVASLLKRWFIGTLHYRVEHQQLPYYLDEYSFRFNRRRSRSRGMLFYRLLQQAMNTDPHPLHELLGGTTQN